MALNLPDSPSLNDIYQDSTTGFSYQWDGSIWRSYRVTATTSATDLVDDASPQLGANLDLNSSSITGTGNINITGVVTATSFVKSSGTSSQFLKADGSVDSSVYITSADGGNAGTLDGIDSSSFLRSDADDTMSGVLSLSSNTRFPLVVGGSDNGKLVLRDANNPFIRFEEGTTSKAYIQWLVSGILQLGNQEDGSSIRIKDDFDFSPDGSNFYTIWHANNDGSGSGLDADTLDGQEGSYYLNYNNFTNTPTIPTNNNQLTNGAGFITTSFTNTNQLTNGAGFITGTDNTTGTSGGLSGAPSITVTDITAVGNVSIAGTLTYEDVTSIDAIGIVTARTGVRVTSGGLTVSAGGANITGVTTSTSFVKSGGTSSQFLKADGSVDSSVYITSADGGNAATLDGIDSSSFLRSDADDSFSGRLTATGSQDEFLKYNGSGTSPYIRMSTNGTSNGYIQFTTSEAWMYSSRRNAGLVLNTNGIQYYTTGGGYNNIWHAGNDGSGSGLDADTLDGVQLSKFVYDKGSSLATNSSWNIYEPGIHGVASASAFTGSGAPSGVYTYGHVVTTENNGQGMAQIYFPHTGSSSSEIQVRTGWNGSYEAWATVWTSNSDGSGSGLDADKLDGIQASSFLRSDAADQKTSGTLRFNDNIILSLGSGDDAEFFCNGSHLYLDLNSGIGNFYIRDGSTTRYTFDDNGSFTATGNVTAYSDIRLKENIEVIPNALEKVSAIRGVTYDRIDNEDLPRQSGVIAQEVETVLPEVVSTDEKGIKSVAYGNLVGLLIEAVKELKSEVETLKAERN